MLSLYFAKGAGERGGGGKCDIFIPFIHDTCINNIDTCLCVCVCVCGVGCVATLWVFESLSNLCHHFSR